MKILLLISILVNVCYAGNDAWSDKIIASTLILEAGGEQDPRAMSAVMEVIHNRAVKRNKSYTQICIEWKAFSCWNELLLENGISKASQHRKWTTAMNIVNSFYKGKITNYTYGADHFCHIRLTPGWAGGKMPTVTIEHHKFYRING